MSMPRGLVILASIWFFGSWVLCIGLRPPVHPSLASYAPGVRLLLACVAVGLCAGWPLLRLSGPRERWPVFRVVMDLAVLLALFHVVLWPLRLATPWPPARLALMDAIVFGWTAIVGAIIAVSIRTNHARTRTLAMVCCVLITVLGLPLRVAAESLGLAPPPAWLQGPVMSSLILGSEAGTQPVRGAWIGVLALAMAVLAAWGAMLGWLRATRLPVAATPSDG